MERNQIKVSIITAMLNSRESLEQCIMSVNKQTYGDIEHIFVDGESNDGSKNYAQLNAIRKPKFYSQKAEGVYSALNAGIEHATGDIVGFLHSDDFFADKNVITEIVEIFNNRYDIVGVYGNLEYVRGVRGSKRVRLWTSAPPKRMSLHLGWMPPHPTVFVRSHVYSRASFNTLYRISADYEWIVRVFKQKEYKFFYYPKILVRMRIGGVSNKNLKNIARKTYEDYNIIKSHRLWGVLTLLSKNVRKIPQFFNFTHND